MRWPGIITTGVLLVVLSGCVTSRSYTMELLQPPLVIPSTIHGEIVLVNNTILQPETVGHYRTRFNKTGDDSVYSIPYRVDTFVNLLLDYSSVRIKTEAFYTQINTVSTNNTGIGKKIGKAYLLGDSLNKTQRMSLKKNSSNTSLLLSLDGLLLESMEYENRDKLDSLLLNKKRVVYVHTVWRAYDGVKDSLLLKYVRSDSLVWKTGYTRLGKALKQLPSIESTLPEIADFVAGEVYKLVSPYWEQVKRGYYVDGGAQFKMGADEVSMGNWEKAAEHWQYAYEKGRALNPYRAAQNMMLYCERKGDFQGAYVWAQRAEVAAHSGLYSPNAYEYGEFRKRYEEIVLRLGELERLKPFLGGDVK